MQLLAILSSVLLAVFTPCSLPSEEGERIAAAYFGDTLVVAYLPSVVASHEERAEGLEERAERISASEGKDVLLIDDLRAYLSLKRMESRGVSEYERRALAAALAACKEEFHFVRAPAAAAD